METKDRRVQSRPTPPLALTPWHALVGVAWLVAGALYLWLPPSPDQFNLSYMGWRLLSGDAPYVDFIDVNWPGVIGLHALATGVFGNHLWTWRAFDFLLFAASAAFLVDLVRRAGGPVAARTCALVSPLLYVAAGYWISGQHDMSAAQLLVVALWCHVRGYDRHRWPWQIGTGLLLGAAMLCKPTVGVMLPLLALQGLVLGEPWRRVGLHTLVATLAMLAAIAAAVLAVWLRGTTLSALFEATIVFVFASQYIDDEITRHRSLWAMLLRTLGRRWGDLALAALPAAIWLFRRSNRSVATTALPLLWLTGVLSYFIQARGLPYHFAPSFLALVGMVSMSVGVLLAAGRHPAARPRASRVVLASLALVLLAGEGYKLALLYRTVPWAGGDAARHLARFGANDGISVNDAVTFARLVAADDSSPCVLVVGNGSAINYLSGRKQPTRFYYFPVIARVRPPLPMAERWLALWASDLDAAQCRSALIAREVHDGWLTRPGAAADSLRRFLAAYDEAGTLGGPGGMVVYRRR